MFKSGPYSAIGAGTHHKQEVVENQNARGPVYKTSF